MNSRLREFSPLALPKNSNIFHVTGQKFLNTQISIAPTRIFLHRSGEIFLGILKLRILYFIIYTIDYTPSLGDLDHFLLRRRIRCNPPEPRASERK